MAKLTLSTEELIELVISNGLLPSEIVRVRAKGERIQFVIKTSSFILPYIPASLRYVSFDGDNAIFELTIVSSHATKAVGWLNELIKIKIPHYMKLEYPKLFVEINRLLVESSVKGVRIKDVSFADGKFAIITENV